MLLSLITIYPFPGDESKVIDALDSMQGAVTTKADCQGCFLTVEAITGKSICYMERWRTREALDRHLGSPLYRQILEVIELSRIPPTFEFLEVKELGGLNLVEQARFLIPSTGNTTKANTIGFRDHLIGKNRSGKKLNHIEEKANEANRPNYRNDRMPDPGWSRLGRGGCQSELCKTQRKIYQDE